MKLTTFTTFALAAASAAAQWGGPAAGPGEEHPPTAPVEGGQPGGSYGEHQSSGYGTSSYSTTQSLTYSTTTAPATNASYGSPKPSYTSHTTAAAPGGYLQNLPNPTYAQFECIPYARPGQHDLGPFVGPGGWKLPPGVPSHLHPPGRDMRCWHLRLPANIWVHCCRDKPTQTVIPSFPFSPPWQAPTQTSTYSRKTHPHIWRRPTRSSRVYSYPTSKVTPYTTSTLSPYGS